MVGSFCHYLDALILYNIYLILYSVLQNMKKKKQCKWKDLEERNKQDIQKEIQQFLLPSSKQLLFDISSIDQKGKNQKSQETFLSKKSLKINLSKAKSRKKDKQNVRPAFLNRLIKKSYNNQKQQNEYYQIGKSLKFVAPTSTDIPIEKANNRVLFTTTTHCIKDKLMQQIDHQPKINYRKIKSLHKILPHIERGEHFIKSKKELNKGVCQLKFDQQYQSIKTKVQFRQPARSEYKEDRAKEVKFQIQFNKSQMQENSRKKRAITSMKHIKSLTKQKEMVTKKEIIDEKKGEKCRIMPSLKQLTVKKNTLKLTTNYKPLCQIESAFPQLGAKYTNPTKTTQTQDNYSKFKFKANIISPIINF